jgi:hypothetical protein
MVGWVGGRRTCQQGFHLSSSFMLTELASVTP